MNLIESKIRNIQICKSQSQTSHFVYLPAVTYEQQGTNIQA